MDDWISPYTFIEYSFEQAIQIEDLKKSSVQDAVSANAEKGK